MHKLILIKTKKPNLINELKIQKIITVEQDLCFNILIKNVHGLLIQKRKSIKVKEIHKLI